MSVPRKPKALKPAKTPAQQARLQEEAALLAEGRPRGRPKGTGTGKTTRSIHVSIPIEIADWLDEQPNASAAVTEALRLFMKRSSRR